MDIKKIEKLIELLDNSTVAEIEITEGETSIRLSRSLKSEGEASVMSTMPTMMLPSMYPPMAPSMPLANVGGNQPAPALADTAPAPEGSLDASLSGKVIRSPMVGTFYSSSSPTSDPFVTLGAEIKVGDVICIVEAMKMFNQIESDLAGKVVRILVENGDPVEYDQPLIVLE